MCRVNICCYQGYGRCNQKGSGRAIMADSGRRRRPLVAERRYGRTTKKTAKPAARKPVGKKPVRRKPARHRNPVAAFFIGIIRFFWRIIWGVSWRLGTVALLLLGLAVGYFYSSLPDLDQVLDGRQRGSVTLLDANGAKFAWRGDQFGGVVTADMVSPHLKNAVIAIEDKRFYRHFGVSPRGIASAIRIPTGSSWVMLKKLPM